MSSMESRVLRHLRKDSGGKIIFHPLLVIYRQSLPLNRIHTHFRLHSLPSWNDGCRCLSFSVLGRNVRNCWSLATSPGRVRKIESPVGTSVVLCLEAEFKGVSVSANVYKRLFQFACALGPEPPLRSCYYGGVALPRHCLLVCVCVGNEFMIPAMIATTAILM